MMTRVNALSKEDLIRWRVATADKEMADNCFPGMSVDDGRRAILHYYKVLGDLYDEYTPKEERPVHFSPIEGGIYVDDD